MGLSGEYDTISTTGGWMEKWKVEMKEKSSRKWKLEKKEKSSKKTERKRELQEGDERRAVRRRWKGSLTS